MALNYTPIRGYINAKMETARMNQQLGNVARGIGEFVQGKMYEGRKNKFFESLGDGEREKITNAIAEIDNRIAELESELNQLGAM